MQKGNSGSSPMDLRKCDIFCVCGKGSMIVIVKGGKRELIFVSGTSSRMGTQNPIFRYPESAEKWVEGMLKKTFVHFLPYLMSEKYQIWLKF